mgnify:CR=1 FL=1
MYGVVSMEYKDENASLDFFIGKKVKQRRSELRLSQSDLGKQLGVSFQQVQKYENGKNRISASTLFHISQILGVDFSYFVNGYSNASALREDSCLTYRSHDRESTLLINYFSKLQDRSLRKQILDLIKKIASLPVYN